MDSAHYADMPKGFAKVKEMVDALLAEPMATFATSAKCTIHNRPCPIHGAKDARMYGRDRKSGCGSNQAVRKSM